MRVLTIGRNVKLPGFESTPLFSNVAFLDFDVVVLDLQPELVSFIDSAPKVDKFLDQGPGELLDSTLQRRAQELREFLAHDRSAVVLVTPVGRYTWYDRPTASRQVRDAGALLPGCGGDVISQSGHSVEFCGPDWTKPIAPSLMPHIEYGGVLVDARMGSGAIPLFRIKGTKKTLGALYDHGNSWMLVIPQLPHTHPAHLALAASIDALQKIYAHRLAEPVLPEWHVEFLLPIERDLRRNAETLASEREDIEKRISENHAQVAQCEEQKGLFLDKGDRLVACVKNAFEQLGFNVSAGPEGRDDLIAEYDGNTAVIEVKGRDTSSAAEKDAAQLEKWVSRLYEERGKEPKGILIVNGYKDLPLDKRIDPVFPNQMLQYCRRKEQCLISGLQLLCIITAATTPDAKREAAQKILSTVGVYPDFANDEWQRVLLTQSSSPGG